MGSESKGCQKALSRRLALFRSLSFSLQPFSIISAQTSLLKRVKLKPQFWKLQNSIINAQLSLRLHLGSGLRWDRHTTAHTQTYTHIKCIYADKNS